MNWKTVQSNERPDELDKTSSHVYNFVRRNIVEKTREDEQTGETVVYYEYEEAKITKSDWSLYEKLIAHDDALDDVYAALTELADMIVEV